MIYEGKTVKDCQITYIGGGSRAWAWVLMNDLCKAKDISGTVRLYDIDAEAAKKNEVIGNRIEAPGHWTYKTASSLQEALTGTDFVIISILPGTFDEMESDVHSPEKYDVYQSVGDTTGPGGLIRALRTIPMIREIAAAVRSYAPKAWVINYTNPMAICIKTLYTEFPEIKAFGCCHEVFGTQALIGEALKEVCGVTDPKREEICVNVVGVNHFTWFTKGKYHNIDLFDVYRKFVDKYYESGFTSGAMGNWMNDSFQSAARVRFDLFRRFGSIAAAGDRHLAEFMDKEDYLTSPEVVKSWKFGLTPVSWRKEDLKARLARSERLYSGEEQFNLNETGEEGVSMIRALLGLSTVVTNVNLPNRGQISNLPLGSVVETNATFRADSVEPVMAGEIPAPLLARIAKVSEENDEAVAAGFSQSFDQAYEAFRRGHLVKTLTEAQKKELFDTMIQNTKKYLTMYH